MLSLRTKYGYMSLEMASGGEEGGSIVFWKQVHLLSPVTLIGLVNREEKGGKDEREAVVVRYNRELRTRPCEI